MGDIICVFEISHEYEDEKNFSGPSNYCISGFSARPKNEKRSWIKRKALEQVYFDAYPLLEKLLTFIHQTWAQDREFSLRSDLSDDLFWSIEEQRWDDLEGFLSTARNYIFIWLKWPSISDEIKEEHSLVLDWVEPYSVDDEMESLAEDLLKPNSPLDQLKHKLFEKYLSGGQPLPEEDIYVEKYAKLLRPYFRPQE